MLSTEAQSVLRRIRTDVLEGHWIKGQGSDGQGNFCLSGHITHQAPESPSLHWEVYDAVNDVVHKRGYPSIPSFNDSTRTRRVDVIEVIDQAMQK